MLTCVAAPQNRQTDREIIVVIPVYNAVSSLNTAVNSVRSQPYSQAKIILVDDGSTDGSSALCDQFAASDTNVHVIHQENSGVSSARNIAIEYCLQHYTDGYVAFLDADDFWNANALSLEVQHYIQTEHDIDIFAFGGFRSNADMTCFSVPYTYSDEIRSGGNSAIWSLKGQFVANFYSLNLLRKWNIRFFPTLKYSEDVIFRLQCSFLSRRIHYLAQILYCYRENHTSAMSKVLQIPPIDYFIPIINGWIQSDEFLNSFAKETHAKCRAGEILSGIYFMDMAEYHFRRGYGKTALYGIFHSHPHFCNLTNLSRKDISPKQYSNKQLLLKHPFLFQCKYRILGYFENIARRFATTKVGVYLRNKWRYPLSSMPVNN